MFSVATFMVFGATSGTSSGSSFWPALIGAIVGGALSLGTTLLVEYRRGRTADTERKRQLRADARLAGRVITLELSDAQSVLRITIQKAPFRWPPASGYDLPDRAWSEYSARLGAVVSSSVWDEVALPYSSFKYANLLGTMNASTAATILDETESAIGALDSWFAATGPDKTL